MQKTTAAKFWVSIIAALNAWLIAFYGVDLGLDQHTATQIIAGVNSLVSGLVWLVPNRPKV